MADRIFKLTFLADVKNAIGDIDKLGDKIGGMSGKTKAIAGAAAVGGAAIGAVAVKGFMSAITLAADYEKAIDQVGAVASATADQQKQLYDTGRRIGRETAFTANEAAAAMEELAAQGLTVDQIVNGAADATVALAAAGGVDLVTAATAAAQTMGVFGVKAENMNDVVNRIAGAANVSKFGVADMTLALGQGAGVAAAAGVSYQDFLTTIAATANSFSSGADAGTGFKTFLQRMVPTGKAATNAMRDLGLITKEGHNRFFDAKGDFLGMANAAQILKEGLGGLSDEAKTDALKDIFGSDASRTAASLAEAGGAGFTKIDVQMGNTDAADIAKQRMDNLSGALDRLKGSLEDIGIGLGERFLPGLTKAADFLAEWLPKIPTPVLLAVGAFAVFIGIVSSLALVLLPIAALAGALGIGIGALLLPFLAIGAAILAAIAIGVLLWQNWDTVKQKATELKDWIVGVFNSLPDVLRVPLQILAAVLLAPFQAVKSIIDSILGTGPKTGDARAPSPEDARAKLGITVGQMQNWGGGEGESYASGGMIPGTGPRLAIVHGGEQVLTPSQQGGVTNNFYYQGFADQAGIERFILATLNNSQQRGALGF